MTSGGDSLKILFSEEISQGSGKRTKILFFTHRQADPDAICAASGLSNLLRTFGDDLEMEIVVPRGASSLAMNVCSKLGIAFRSEVDVEEISSSDIIVIVDTGNSHLLEPYYDMITRSEAKKILIDHHSTSQQPDAWKEIDRKLILPNSTSTCEIIALGFPNNPISKQTAQILLTGLMFDSQHLGLATACTLEATLILVRAGAEIDVAKNTLRNRPDRSEIIARVKSAQRIQFEEIRKFVVLTTEVSSFHASVARMLLEIGADIGIAFGESDHQTRVSMRSTQNFHKETGVDLSVLTRKICDEFRLEGGGHPTAASISGTISTTSVVAAVINSLRLELPQ